MRRAIGGSTAVVIAGVQPRARASLERRGLGNGRVAICDTFDGGLERAREFAGEK